MRATLFIIFIFLLVILGGAVGTAGAYINHASAVPIHTVAWLFFSALIGFIVVASRRKL